VVRWETQIVSKFQMCGFKWVNPLKPEIQLTKLTEHNVSALKKQATNAVYSADFTKHINKFYGQKCRILGLLNKVVHLEFEVLRLLTVVL
jgi:hypothetical protein